MSPTRDTFDSTLWETTRGSSQSLADLCSEVFFMIFHILGGNDPGQPDSLRKEVALLLQDIERRGKRYGQAEEDVKATRYAMCALIDETILNSQWSFKDQWGDRPLQLEYFGEHMAGERFFDLLERIRKKGSRKADLLEVFCITLILGFQGKYKMQGKEELDKLIRELVRELDSYRGGPHSLSPHWKIPKEPTERPPSIVPRWVWITGLVSILAVIIVFAAFKIWLNSNAADAAARMIL